MDERMMILNMLQEGKITSEEAYKLLSAIDGSKTSKTETQYTNRKIEIDMEDKLNKFAEKATKLAEKMNQKANKFAEKFNEGMAAPQDRNMDDFARRLEGVGNDIAESAVKFADKLVNYLGGLADISSDKLQQYKSYTYPAEGIKDISIASENFSIKVNPSETDEIIVNLYVSSLSQNINLDECFTAEFNGGSCRLATKFPMKSWGRMELLLPKSLAGLSINTSNGKCEVTGINSENAKYQTSNGKIILEDCDSKMVDTISSNGKITFDNVRFGSALISTSNGKIELFDSKVNNIDAKTSNGAIFLSGVKTVESGEGRYSLYTSNGKIEIEIDNAQDCGFLVDANTTLGAINVDLPTLSYFIDRKASTMHASTLIRSNGFEEQEKKVSIRANTSNASISIINKK